MDLIAQIKKVELKFEETERKLSDPDIFKDNNQFKKINRLRVDLEPTINKGREYVQVLKNLEEAQTLLQTEKDPELRQLAKDEMESAKKKKLVLEEELKLLLVPSDPDDSKNCYLEIRQGTGGEEAALFAGDLYGMYRHFCESQGFQLETLSFSTADAGGIKEVIALVSGPNAYGTLKYESGTHRVQRVPKTEASGRVHTSAATVAVIPEQEEIDFEINPADLRVDTYRASGAGGQHINKTDSAVRITHIPTGVFVACQEARSQHRNRELAMNLLKSRLFESQQTKQREAEASHRKQLVGSGDRSEKIRTYNFPQSRVTDHRINLTLYNLDRILKGELSELISALQNAERVKRLEQMDAV